MQGRTVLQTEIQSLHEQLYEMGTLAYHSLKASLVALTAGDIEHSKQIIEQDKTINETDLRVNEHIVQLLVTQQPVATDLRTLTAMMKVSTDLERLGDLAVEIAKANLHRIPQAFSLEETEIITEMGEYSVRMLKGAIEAFYHLQVNEVKQIEEQDRTLDDLYGRAIQQFILNTHDERTIVQLAYTARSLERVGDHCTNLAEQVLYVVEGVHRDLNRH
ncbi:phosphate signaling complex protein PhoU [Geomicrobium sp. JSM 1781026]|uniref:phosphate signaling complex protein PhoU n=1 Tax=Geomicrobium sp. JSM 1781026 TaxID=3344580 RepID=UPI0035C0439E